MLSGDKNLSQYMLPGKMVPIQSMDGQIPGHIQKALLAEVLSMRLFEPTEACYSF